jgi:hypothetical protein
VLPSSLGDTEALQTLPTPVAAERAIWPVSLYLDYTPIARVCQIISNRSDRS